MTEIVTDEEAAGMRAFDGWIGTARLVALLDTREALLAALDIATERLAAVHWLHPDIFPNLPPAIEEGRSLLRTARGES